MPQIPVSLGAELLCFYLQATNGTSHGRLEAVSASAAKCAAFAANVAVGDDGTAASLIDFKPVPVRAIRISVANSLPGSRYSNSRKLKLARVTIYSLMRNG
jgi:hypothetical protein